MHLVFGLGGPAPVQGNVSVMRLGRRISAGRRDHRGGDQQRQNMWRMPSRLDREQPRYLANRWKAHSIPPLPKSTHAQ